MKKRIHKTQRVRVVNLDGYRHGEIGIVNQVSRGIATVEFNDGGTSGIPVESLVHDNPKTRPLSGQLNLFGIDHK